MVDIFLFFHLLHLDLVDDAVLIFFFFFFFLFIVITEIFFFFFGKIPLSLPKQNH